MFRRDLRLGQEVEQEVAALLEARGYFVEYNNSEDLEILREWDLRITKGDRIETVEVKADFMSSKTGNVAIEIKCIENSKAGLFIYKLDNEFWYTTTAIMQSFKGREVWGGDNNKTKLRLVKKQEFIKKCKQLT